MLVGEEMSTVLFVKVDYIWKEEKALVWFICLMAYQLHMDYLMPKCLIIIEKKEKRDLVLLICLMVYQLLMDYLKPEFDSLINVSRRVVQKVVSLFDLLHTSQVF